MKWRQYLFKRITSFVEKSIVRKWRSDFSTKLSGFLHSLVSTTFRQWIVAFVCSLAICISCYIIDNQPYSILEDSDLYYLLERPFQPKIQSCDTDVCFVNVSHDRQLAYINPDDHDAGNTDITDRRKLLQFLRKIEDDQVKYKYIMMDIRFDKNLKTEYDDSLFHQIAKMRDIVIAHHHSDSEDYDLADTILRPKLGMSDYRIIPTAGSFSRYTFLQDNKPSLALKMYDEYMKQPTSIKKSRRLPIFSSNRHLCANSPLLYITGKVYSIMNLPTMEEDNDMTLSDGIWSKTFTGVPITRTWVPTSCVWTGGTGTRTWTGNSS